MNQRRGAVLVVGGAGYIGCHAARELGRRGYEAIIYDNLSTGHKFLAEGFELIVGDIADSDKLKTVLQRVQAVMHFAAYTIVLRPLSRAWGAIPATAASTVVGTLPYLAFAGTLSAPRLAQLPPSVWGELAFLALGSSVAGMLLWNRAIVSGGATRVSLLLYLEPVVSVLGAVIFLGERVTMVTIAGGLLILAGVATASIRRRARLPDADYPVLPDHDD